MKRPQKFISIVWGYHSQLYKFSPVENYHLHALNVARALGYKTEVYLMSPKANISLDPNYTSEISVIRHRNTFSMIAYLFRNRDAVIYANTVLWQNLLLVPFIGRHTIYMAHDSIKRRSPLKRLVQRIAVRFYSRVRVIARGEKEFLVNEGVPAEKIFVAPLALDLSLFSGNASGTGMVFLGNVTPDNDFQTIIKALAIVRKTRPSERLAIIGEIRIPEWGALVAEYGLENAIDLLGVKTHKEIAEILPRFAIGVSSVISSGQHLSIFEYALSGLALTIPDTMQFNSVFNECALFHPLYDSTALARNMLAYLENTELRLEHNTRAQEIIRKEYSVESLEKKARAVFSF